MSLTTISYFYLDTRIAQFVYRLLNSSDQLLQTVTNIPDLLLPIVITITVSSWVGYFILVRRGIHNRLTDFLRACGTVAPLAFVAKAVSPRLPWLAVSAGARPHNHRLSFSQRCSGRRCARIGVGFHYHISVRKTGVKQVN